MLLFRNRVVSVKFVFFYDWASEEGLLDQKLIVQYHLIVVDFVGNWRTRIGCYTVV